MPKPYDITTRALIETSPQDWLELLGLPREPVEIVDVQITTISSEADRVIRVNGVKPYILHIELQASYDANLPMRLLRYSVLLSEKYGLPVYSVIVLLRPQADGPAMTGHIEQAHRKPDPYLRFGYEVARIWEFAASDILRAGEGALPLAPLGNITESELPTVIHAIGRQLDEEADHGRRNNLWLATYILLGLRYKPGVIENVLLGARAMRESLTYQKILEEGRAEGREEARTSEARRIISLQGSRRFGAISAENWARLDKIQDVNLLERLAGRLLDVESWEELLAED